MTQKHLDLVSRAMKYSSLNDDSMESTTEESRRILSMHLKDHKIKKNIGHKAEFVQSALGQTTRVHGVILSVNGMGYALNFDDARLNWTPVDLPDGSQIFVNFEAEKYMSKPVLQRQNAVVEEEKAEEEEDEGADYPDCCTKEELSRYLTDAEIAALMKVDAALDEKKKNTGDEGVDIPGCCKRGELSQYTTDAEIAAAKADAALDEKKIKNTKKRGRKRKNMDENVDSCAKVAAK